MHLLRFSFFAVSAIAGCVLASSLTLGACDTVKLIPAPDASVDCAKPVVVGGKGGCVIQPAGSTGCSAALPAVACFGEVASEALLDAGLYSVGCEVLVQNPTPDEDLACSQLGGCNCYATDAGTYEWSCTPCTDAGQ